MVRTLVLLTPSGDALSDPQVAAEVEKSYAAFPWMWSGPGEHCYSTVRTLILRARALATLVDEPSHSAAALRAWLPSAEELIWIATHEFVHQRQICGTAHPTLSCATLYADRLGEWDVATAIAEGVLAISPADEGGLDTQSFMRIEAWRLLARCRAQGGLPRAAFEALQHAVNESKAMHYVWMEACSRRDQLEYAADQAEIKRLRDELEAVTAGFTGWQGDLHGRS